MSDVSEVPAETTVAQPTTTAAPATTVTDTAPAKQESPKFILPIFIYTIT